MVSPGGLVTITGGKWTTYRRMAEDAVDNAVFIAKLPQKDCITKDLPIGNPRNRNGSIERLINQDRLMEDRIHPGFPYTKADVLYAVRNEMAMTIEDVLARRTRLLFLDAQAAIDIAPVVAALMAKELLMDEHWQAAQVNEFKVLAAQYLLS